MAKLIWRQLTRYSEVASTMRALWKEVWEMFPANIIATNGSFRQKVNVSSNLEKEWDKGFQMYNVYNPSYWKYRERMVFGEQNTNVSNVANYSASSSTDSNALKLRRGRTKGSATKPKKANNKRVFREKSAFKYTELITLGLLNSPYERANCKTLYNFIGYHFPSIQSIPHAKNSIRHALTDDKGRFQRVPNGYRRDSVYTFGVDSREKMISSVIEMIETNENTTEKLMMRNLWDLPGILAGICPVPEGFVMESHILNVSSEQNSSYSTNNESFESSTYGDDLPEDLLVIEPSNSLETRYRNQPHPALRDHDYCK